MEENFEEELEMLKKEAKAIDDLFGDLKEHYDEVKQNSKRASGGLAFLHQQASNLVSLRNNKINVLKAIVDTKSKKFMNNVKIEMLNKGNGAEDSTANMMLLMEDFMNKFPTNHIMKTVTGQTFENELLEEVKDL